MNVTLKLLQLESKFKLYQKEELHKFFSSTFQICICIRKKVRSSKLKFLILENFISISNFFERLNFENGNFVFWPHDQKILGNQNPWLEFPKSHPFAPNSPLIGMAKKLKNFIGTNFFPNQKWTRKPMVVKKISPRCPITPKSTLNNKLWYLHRKNICPQQKNPRNPFPQKKKM